MPAVTESKNLRNRLLWRIQRSYAITTSEVRIGPLDFPFTRIADPDRVLDEIAEEADRRERVTGRRESDEHLHLPYWAELWDSAMGMALVLDRETSTPGDKAMGEAAGTCRTKSFEIRPHVSAVPEVEPEMPGKRGKSVSLSPFLPVSLSSSRVIDLGCGMGLSGTVAAGLGAQVMFADIEPPALLFARLNSLPWRERVRVRRINWKTDQLGEMFDLILGADIVYERSQWEFLEPFWRGHLAPGGMVMLGEPGRQTGDLFMDWIRARGWELSLKEQNVQTRERAIRVIMLRIRG